MKFENNIEAFISKYIYDEIPFKKMEHFLKKWVLNFDRLSEKCIYLSAKDDESAPIIGNFVRLDCDYTIQSLINIVESGVPQNLSALNILNEADFEYREILSDIINRIIETRENLLKPIGYFNSNRDNVRNLQFLLKKYFDNLSCFFNTI